MANVLKAFRDKEDKDYLYKVGSFYPRKGLEPTDKRIDELSNKGFIEKEPDYSKMLKDELLEIAEQKDLDVSESNTKADIIEAIEGE